MDSKNNSKNKREILDCDRELQKIIEDTESRNGAFKKIIEDIEMRTKNK